MRRYTTCPTVPQTPATSVMVSGLISLVLIQKVVSTFKLSFLLSTFTVPGIKFELIQLTQDWSPTFTFSLHLTVQTTCFLTVGGNFFFFSSSHHCQTSVHVFSEQARGGEWWRGEEARERTDREGTKAWDRVRLCVNSDRESSRSPNTSDNHSILHYQHL